ncbi:unnamed protein product [Symbiodinium sp. CCMP2456]|nr:unnamed protein product [Symbiodinium sp. CCMP2456]
MESQAIQSWWKDTTKLVKHFLKEDFLIVAGDLNASVGSEISDAIGGLAAEKEDEAGECVRNFARDFQLWLPSTFSDIHTGATHTYQQKKSGKLCRPDYVLLPEAWAKGQILSWTDPEIHAAHVNQDHTATVVDARVCFQLVGVYHLKVAGQALREACRADRDAYTNDLALQFENGSSRAMYAAYHRLLGHKRKKPFQLEPPPGIKKADGSVCSDQGELLERWRSHFGALEAGRATSVLALVEEALATSGAQQEHWPHPEDTDCAPTEAFLQRTLASTKLGKAPGFDALPLPELCKTFAPELAAALHPLALKHVWLGQEAASFKEVFRKDGAALATGRAHWLQCGLWGPSGPVRDSHCISPAQAQLPCVRRHRVSVLRGDHPVDRIMQRHNIGSGLCQITGQPNLTAEDVADIRAHLQADSAMHTAGSNAWLEALADNISGGNWFILKNDVVPVRTYRGTRPGSAFADVVFALLIPRVLALRDALRSSAIEHSCAPVLPWDGEFVLKACTCEEPRSSITVSEVVWADDLAIPRWCHTADSVRAGIATEAGALADAFSSFGMRLSVAHEVRYRISQAKAAFQEAKRKVFKNRAISLRRKAVLLQSTVLSRLLQGAGSWPPLVNRDRHAFDATIWAFYRVPRGGEQDYTALSCCALARLDSPDTDTILRRCRLSYLRQLVQSGPPQLWAAIRSDREYAEMLEADLRWLCQWTHATTELQHPDQHWSLWWQCMKHQPGCYKGLVKRACALDGCRISLVAALDQLHRALCAVSGGRPCLGRLQEEPLTDLCLPCRRAFRSKVAWAGHAARMHGYRSSAYLTGSGNLCLCCGKNFGSVGRLRRHLTVVPACVQGWGSFQRASSTTTTEVHPLAPPFLEQGTWRPIPVAADCQGISPGLLSQLEQLAQCDEQEVWQCIEDYIEPLSVLRATVIHWREQHRGSEWHVEVAENMLLLLDPEVSADFLPDATKAVKTPPFLVPNWGLPGRLDFDLSGAPFQPSLERPPAVCMSLHDPTSVSLRDANALVTWAEAACTVVARCAAKAQEGPVLVDCLGLWKALPPLQSWLEALGFACEESGFRSPG